MRHEKTNNNPEEVTAEEPELKIAAGGLRKLLDGLKPYRPVADGSHFIDPRLGITTSSPFLAPELSAGSDFYI